MIDQTIGQAAEHEAEGEDIDQTIGQAAEQETEGEDIRSNYWTSSRTRDRR